MRISAITQKFQDGAVMSCCHLTTVWNKKHVAVMKDSAKQPSQKLIHICSPSLCWCYRVLLSCSSLLPDSLNLCPHSLHLPFSRSLHPSLFVFKSLETLLPLPYFSLWPWAELWNVLKYIRSHGVCAGSVFVTLIGNAGISSRRWNLISLLKSPICSALCQFLHAAQIAVGPVSFAFFLVFRFQGCPKC